VVSAYALTFAAFGSQEAQARHRTAIGR
jgi:hypothetical protein